MNWCVSLSRLEIRKIGCGKPVAGGRVRNRLMRDDTGRAGRFLPIQAPIYVVLSVVFLMPFPTDSAAQILLDPLDTPPSKLSHTPPIPGILTRPTSRSGLDGSIGEEWDDDTGENAPRTPLGGFTPGGGFAPGSGFRPGRPGMTLEEIRRQKMQEAWEKEMRDRENWRRIMLEFRVKESVDELLEKSRSYVPTQLRNPSPQNSPNDGADKEHPDAIEKTTSTEARAIRPDRLGKSEDRQRDSGGEELSDDERMLRDWKNQLAELDKREDSEEKERLKKSLEDRIRSREQYIERRTLAERGADFFQIPSSVKLTESQLQEGWCNLFDGKTFFGWRTQNEGHYGGGRFHIEQGEIHSDPRHPGLLYTTNQFGDSTVSLEYLADEDAEVYLLLRTPADPRNIHWSCYTIVLNSSDFQSPPGSILGRQQLSVEQLQELNLRESNRSKTERRAPRWRTLSAQFDGASLSVTVDRNESMTHYDAKPLGYGYIGLLVTKGKVRFRNLVWRPGSSLSLFDGLSPEKHWRWRTDAIQVSATRNISMQVAGGPGVVETLDQYDNFVFQVEYNIAYTSGRTGIFFRSRPREEQTGYEVSVQNFPKRDDRDTTVGIDVGSFRNRKSGRYIRPQDQTWNYLTLVAVDRQFQTWVNGVPVSEMSDRRPFSGESTDGPFLNPGTIQLLAPDAQSSLQFRNIRVMPIAPRTDKPRSFEDRTKTTWESQINERREREKEQKLDGEMRKKQPPANAKSAP